MLFLVPLLLATVATAQSPQGSNVPLTKRSSAAANESIPHRLTRLSNSVVAAKMKYTSPGSTSPSIRRRAATVLGTVQMADVQGDVQYYGSIQIGTPPVQYEVILDTGSSDCVIATSPCSGCSSTTPLYSTKASSTSVKTNTPFSITYGTGAAQGTLAQDVMSMGGYTIQKQVFAAITTFDNIVAGDLTGLLGMGWQTIATSGATPFLQALWKSGQLPSPVFGFGFARWNMDAKAQDTVEPGGELNIGHVNSTLYTQPINYIPLVNSGTYWLIPLDNIKLGGVSLGVSATQVTIDTGTTLIGVPAAAARAIYSQIAGAARYQNDGLFTFPCATQVSISFTFGGVDYPILPGDFNNGATSSSGRTCVGAVFELAPAGSVDQWIFGDAFLKNVYTAFQFSPPAVGFSAITNTAILKLGSVPVSNGTLGTGSQAASQSTTTTTTSSGSGMSSGGVPTVISLAGRSHIQIVGKMVTALSVVVLVMISL